MERRLLEIRAASGTDTDLLFRAYSDSRKAEFAGTGWTEEQLRAFLQMQFDLRSRVYGAQFPNANTFVVKCENADAAVYTVETSETLTRLVDVVVFAEFRRKSIATEIIRLLMEGGRPIEVAVEFRNSAAARLYEKLGFETYQDDDVYRRMRWVPE